MKKKIIVSSILIIFIMGIISMLYRVTATQYYQRIETGISAFPESYQTKLRELSNKYPNWKFQAYKTGISWNELISKERGNDSVHRNRVHVNSQSSWKHDCNFVENDYACASDSIVAYYLDPRNFLNETNIFQFVETSYNEKQQTVNVIANSVKNTFLDRTITCKDFNNNTITMSYAQIIVEAAKQSNISAFYIKSKIIQEVGSWGSGSVSGNYPGHEGYYNFFNFGATDSGDPIANGLMFAEDKGWDSQYKAIIDGAKLIGTQYIDAGQNTAYFNKWDVVGTEILKEGESQVVDEGDMFWHQYMTNIQDPTSQSSSYYKLYSNNLNDEITFIIPVYNDMPASNPMPQDVKLQSISLYTTELNLQIGAQAQANAGTGYVSAAYNPSNATDKVLYWSSSNPSVATVSEGNVKAVGEGTAILTAKSRDGGKTATCRVTVTKIDKALQSIKINQDKVSLKVGETGWVGVTYNPNDASDKVLYWSSSDNSIATVNEGTIKALKRGTVTLTATSRDRSRKATCQVTVTDPNYIELTSIKMNTSEMKLKVGEKSWLGVTYTPSNASNKVLTWTSSNPSVATISEGNITAVGKGTATITAKSADGGKTATCQVTVTDGTIALQSISLKTTKLEMKKGEKAIIYATYNPSDATNKVLTWTSSNSSVATVSEGNVTAVGNGTATITAKAADGGKTATCQVTVTDGTVALQSISLKTTKLEMKKGEKTTIYATYNPTNATNKVLTWTSSNSSVATVSEGNVTAVGNGTATITAKAADGGKTATCQVTVTDGTVALQSLSLKSNMEILTKGNRKTIYAVYNPSNVTDKVLYWTSSNPSVATVSEGNVTAVGNGVTTITAKSRDGGKVATCQIIVVNTNANMNGITLKTTEVTMKKGENQTIYATYNPTNASDKTIYWISSNPNVAIVSEGNVRATGAGTTTVTAITRDGGKVATCTVKVTN